MSSSVTNTLSAGAQFLANDHLLPANLSQKDIENATPEQLAKMAGATLTMQTTSALFGGSTSPDGDTVEFSPEAMNLLQEKGGGFGESNGDSATTLTPSTSSALDSFDLFA